MNFSDFFEALGVPAFGTKVCEPVNCGAGLAIEDGISGGADDSYMVAAPGQGSSRVLRAGTVAARRHSTAK